MTHIPAWADPMHPDFNPTDNRWRALTSDERFDFYCKSQDAAVATLGYTCQAVFPVDEGGYHFAYTIGGETSMIVVGLSATAEPLLDLAMAHADEPDGVPFATGTEGYLMVFAPVPPPEFVEHCAGALARGATSARQLIWQDDERRWPWEEGHFAQQRGDLPVLAGADWRPNADAS